MFICDKNVFLSEFKRRSFIIARVKRSQVEGTIDVKSIKPSDVKLDRSKVLVSAAV